MFFNKKEKISSHLSNIDKLVTGLIIGGAVASIIGLSKKKKKKEVTNNLTIDGEKIVNEGTKIARKGYSCFGKILVGSLRLFSKNEKNDKK